MFRYISGTVVPVDEPEVLTRLPTQHLPNCFGCGSENQTRLGVVPHYVGDKVVAELEFHPRFEGGPGLAHGGAIAAFFDDLIGFVSMAHQRPAVTARLEVNYLTPIPLGMKVRGEAWLSGIEGRKLSTEAAGYRPDGEVVVEVSGLFVQVGVEHFTRAIEDRYRSDEYYP